MVSPRTARKTLDIVRQRLLDQSNRNPFLNLPQRLHRTQALEIVGPQTSRLFRLLFDEGKAMAFDPNPRLLIKAPSDTAARNSVHRLPVPVTAGQDAAADGETIKTPFENEELIRRLRRLDDTARSAVEEQGINPLHLSLGVLEWRVPDLGDTVFHAPLVLVPVELQRCKFGDPFVLRCAADTVSDNPSLRTKLRVDFDITLPRWEDGFDADIGGYFAAVANAVDAVGRWRVIPNRTVLRNMSFRNHLIYSDLDPTNWPEGQKPERNRRFRQLFMSVSNTDVEPLTDAPDATAAAIAETQAKLPPAVVADMDSSQARVLHAVHRGEDLIVEGPPGCGKSSLSVNLMADAARRGQTTAFVTAKAAAKDVVKERLDGVGLGHLCLDLHNTDTTANAFYSAISSSLEPASGNQPDTSPEAAPDEATYAAVIAALDGQAEAMAARHELADISCYETVANLVALRESGVSHAGFELEGALEWRPAGYRQNEELVAAAAGQVAALGTPVDHPWRGAELRGILPMAVARLERQLAKAADRLQAFLRAARNLADRLADSPSAPAELPCPSTVGENLEFAELCSWIGSLHGDLRNALTSSVWHSDGDTIRALVSDIHEVGRFEDRVAVEGWDIDWNADFKAINRRLSPGRSSDESWHAALWRRLKARAQLKTALGAERLPDDPATLAIAHSVVDAQLARRRVEANSDLGHQAFGAYWHGVTSDSRLLSEICIAGSRVADERLAASLFAAIAAGLDVDWSAIADDVIESWTIAEAALTLILTRVEISLPNALGVDRLSSIGLQALIEKVDGWVENTAAITDWIRFRQYDRALREQGMAGLADQLFDGTLVTRRGRPTVLHGLPGGVDGRIRPPVSGAPRL